MDQSPSTNQVLKNTRGVVLILLMGERTIVYSQVDYA